jgi:hypothetical protein
MGTLKSKFDVIGVVKKLVIKKFNYAKSNSKEQNLLFLQPTYSLKFLETKNWLIAIWAACEKIFIFIFNFSF